MKLISIVGHSGSGKTTLIEKLLPMLKAAGLRVATIKHTHHQVRLGHVTAEQPVAGTAAGNPLPHQALTHTVSGLQLDTPGKDSWRFKQAGAVASMLVTPQALQLVVDMPAPHDPLLLAQRYFSDVDLVLAESFSQADCPKIEVLRAACSTVPRCDEGLIAMVTDVAGVQTHLPHFAPDDVDEIVDFILRTTPSSTGRGWGDGSAK